MASVWSRLAKAQRKAAKKVKKTAKGQKGPLSRDQIRQFYHR
jgi:hypothetical protein